MKMQMELGAGRVVAGGSERGGKARPFKLGVMVRGEGEADEERRLRQVEIWGSGGVEGSLQTKRGEMVRTVVSRAGRMIRLATVCAQQAKGGEDCPSWTKSARSCDSEGEGGRGNRKPGENRKLLHSCPAVEGLKALLRTTMAFNRFQIRANANVALPQHQPLLSLPLLL